MRNGLFFGAAALMLLVQAVQAMAAGSGQMVTNKDYGIPKGWPIRFSGARLEPWLCAPDAAPAGAECTVPSRYAFYYRTSKPDCVASVDKPDSCFRPLSSPVSLPEDIAYTTTTEGVRLPYIVRVERGSLDRTLYEVAVLYDSAGKLKPWNQRVVWSFGGGTGSVRRQMAPTSNWANDEALGAGFMSVVSGLTDASINANRVLSAEVIYQIRERIDRTYGKIRWLIGEGCSAGSMQINVINSMYPGLIDGGLLACTFPDTETNTMELTDSWLLNDYFNSAAFRMANADLSADALERKKAAIAGHKDNGTVTSWPRFRASYLPGVVRSDDPLGNNCRLPNALIYDPAKRPEGIRCTTFDHNVPLFGHRPGSNMPLRPLDNVGVQYGLAALIDGAISGAEFVALNRDIGGIDRDAARVPERQQADPTALTLAYGTGLVSDPRQLVKTPIIDLRGDENSSVHAQWNSFALRARLKTVDPLLRNYAIWRVGLPGGGFPWQNERWVASGLTKRSLLTMDRWLARIYADRSALPRAEKVARNRPADLRSFCYIGIDYTHEVTDEARCDADAALAYYGSVRMVAGAPLRNDILKCQLRPVDKADYKGRLTDSQIAEIRAVFAKGVCDWSRPGVGQRPATPWHVFPGSG